ncbi:MAG: histone H1 [Planctomycetota bacterium]|nr:histone H1 [Planctomycetota bacterium]
MSQNFDDLAALVETTRGDVEKAEGGNKAACTRVRKAMQSLKNHAQEIRKEMLEARDAGGN